MAVCFNTALDLLLLPTITTKYFGLLSQTHAEGPLDTYISIVNRLMCYHTITYTLITCIFHRHIPYTSLKLRPCMRFSSEIPQSIHTSECTGAASCCIRQVILSCINTLRPIAISGRDQYWAVTPRNLVVCALALKINVISTLVLLKGAQIGCFYGFSWLLLFCTLDMSSPPSS